MGKAKNVKKTHKKKHKAKKFFAVVLFWLLVLVILTALGFGGYFVFTSDKLKVQSVEVENSEYYTKEQVLEVASIQNGKNMLVLRRNKIKEDILNQLPYIENVKIKLGKDGLVKIIVTERTSKYVVNNKDTNDYIRVDKSGIMLEKVEPEDILPEELPLFGLSLNEGEEVGKSIPETEYNKIVRFEKIFDEYTSSGIDAKITSVKFENSKIILTLDYKTEVVTEVSSNLEYKMKLLKEILKEVAGKGGKIDLTLDSPTFVEKIG